MPERNRFSDYSDFDFGDSIPACQRQTHFIVANSHLYIRPPNSKRPTTDKNHYFRSSFFYRFSFLKTSNEGFTALRIWCHCCDMIQLSECESEFGISLLDRSI